MTHRFCGVCGRDSRRRAITGAIFAFERGGFLPPPPTLRAATAADLDALVALNGAVQRVHCALYPGDFKPAADPGAVRAFLAVRLDAIAVAASEGAVLGYVWFEPIVRPETPFARSVIRLYVHHIAVAPEARRRGIGTALLAHVEALAAEKGCGEVALDAWDANHAALAFFRRQAFAAYDIRLRKPLAPRR